METVRILMPATLIEDGTFHPAIGLDVSYALSFTEVDGTSDPDPVLHQRWELVASELGRAR